MLTLLRKSTFFGVLNTSFHAKTKGVLTYASALPYPMVLDEISITCFACKPLFGSTVPSEVCIKPTLIAIPAVRTHSIFHVYSTPYRSFTFGSKRTVSATDATEDDLQIHSCSPRFSACYADFVWHYNQLWKVLFNPREKRHTQD